MTASKATAVRDAEAVLGQYKAGLALMIGNWAADALNVENMVQANDDVADGVARF